MSLPSTGGATRTYHAGDKALADGTVPNNLTLPVPSAGYIPAASNLNDLQRNLMADPAFKRVHEKTVQPRSFDALYWTGIEAHEEFQELLCKIRNPLDYKQFNNATLQEFFDKEGVTPYDELPERRDGNAWPGINQRWMKKTWNVRDKQTSMNLYSRQAHVIKTILRFAMYGVVQTMMPIDLPQGIDVNFDTLVERHPALKDAKRIVDAFKLAIQIDRKINNFSAVTVDLATAKKLLTSSKIHDGELVAGIDTSEVSDDILPPSTEMPDLAKFAKKRKAEEDEFLSSPLKKVPKGIPFEGYSPEWKIEREKQIKEAAKKGAILPSYRSSGKSKRFRPLVSAIRKPPILLLLTDNSNLKSGVTPNDIIKCTKSS